MNRRNYLGAVGVAAGVLASSSTDAAGATPGDESDSGDGRVTTVNDLLEMTEDELWKLSNETVRRPFNPEIGSGRGYDADEWKAPEGYTHGGDVTRRDADYIAASRSELRDALDTAGEGDVVWIPGDAEIDATVSGDAYYGNTPFVVPGGVTVASNRGRRGADGAKLYLTEPTASAIFRVVGSGARVTGLRLVGPDPEYWTYEGRGVDSIYDVGVSMGIWIEGPSDRGAVKGDTDIVEGVEIDNCHLSGFIYNCVRVGGFAWIGSPRTKNAYVHHCEIVDTPSPGLGYGITVMNGEAFVEFNYFDNNRHAIAGNGGPAMSSYTFQHNLLGPRTRSHVIDMHGGEVDGYDRDVAGKNLVISNNVVLATRTHSGDHGSTVDIRGVPAEQAEISFNWFFSDNIPPIGDCSDPGESSDVIDQWGLSHAFENLRIYNNLMGKFDPLDTIGIKGRWEPDRGRGRDDDHRGGRDDEGDD